MYCDNLSGDGHIFQAWPYLNSQTKIKLLFSQQDNLQRVRDGDRPGKYTSVWREVLYRPGRSSIFYYLININIQHGIFRFLILVSLFKLRVFPAFSLFLKIWLTGSIPNSLSANPTKWSNTLKQFVEFFSLSTYGFLMISRGRGVN